MKHENNFIINLILWVLLIIIILLSSYMLTVKEQEYDKSMATWEDIKELCQGGLQSACDEIIKRAEN